MCTCVSNIVACEDGDCSGRLFLGWHECKVLLNDGLAVLTRGVCRAFAFSLNTLNTTVFMVTALGHEVIALVWSVHKVKEVHELAMLILIVEVVYTRPSLAKITCHICLLSAECILAHWIRRIISRLARGRTEASSVDGPRVSKSHPSTGLLSPGTWPLSATTKCRFSVGLK